MRILAFDQASVKSGWSFFIDGELGSYGVIDLHRSKDPDLRMKEMVTTIFSFISEKKPDMVVVEDVAMQKNPWTLILLSRIQGAILGYCYQSNVDIQILKPSEWRETLEFTQGRGIKQKQLKAQAKELVLNKFNEAVKEDEADAICIGLAAVARYQNG